MKRVVIMFIAISGTLLLGGCGPHWDDGERYGRDHGRGYDEDREQYSRYDSRKNYQGHERNHYHDRDERGD